MIKAIVLSIFAFMVSLSAAGAAVYAQTASPTTSPSPTTAVSPTVSPTKTVTPSPTGVAVPSGAPATGFGN